VDLHFLDAEPTAEEREAVDALLGPPSSGWDGGERDEERDAFASSGGHAARARRHLLLPALQAVQSGIGWISEGALNYICQRLSVPPADAYGVGHFLRAAVHGSPAPVGCSTFVTTSPANARAPTSLCAELERTLGSAQQHGPNGHQVEIGENDAIWLRKPMPRSLRPGPCGTADSCRETAGGALVRQR
jgi:NADH-quinone oxidoreductase subunit F